jgi:hypothetical protein
MELIPIKNNSHIFCELMLVRKPDKIKKKAEISKPETI